MRARLAPKLPDAVVRYADHDDAVIDLHLPEGAGRDRGSSYSCTAGSGRPSGTAGTPARWRGPSPSAGCVVATPEYRRVGGGGGWPVTGDDVLTRGQPAARAPGLARDRGRRCPWSTGHSAGGHLALWLATTGVPIDRVVALAPVCDLREAIRLGLGDDATQALLDGADPDRGRPDGAARRAGRAAEVVIVHGVDDDDVPLSLSRGLVERHPWVELREVPGDHMGLIEPGSAAWPTVLAALTRSRARCNAVLLTPTPLHRACSASITPRYSGMVQEASSVG